MPEEKPEELEEQEGKVESLEYHFHYNGTGSLRDKLRNQTH